MTDNINLDCALNFDSESIFEHMETLLSYHNAETICPEATHTSSNLLEYIGALDIPDVKDAVFMVEDMANAALSENCTYAYRAGFKEGVRLLRTLMKL